MIAMVSQFVLATAAAGANSAHALSRGELQKLHRVRGQSRMQHTRCQTVELVAGLVVGVACLDDAEAVLEDRVPFVTSSARLQVTRACVSGCRETHGSQGSGVEFTLVEALCA